VVGQLWVKLKSKFLIDENGLYYNERLEIEKNKREAYINSRVNNKEGKNQYTEINKDKIGHTSKHMTGHMEDEDVNKDLVNYKEVLENFHFYCDKLSKVERLSMERKKHINARFKEFDLNTIIEVFKKVGKSNFLCGKNDRAWKANFDWIFNETNFLKIMEGKYENQEPKTITRAFVPELQPMPTR
jgi:hypothetical protein